MTERSSHPYGTHTSGTISASCPVCRSEANIEDAERDRAKRDKIMAEQTRMRAEYNSRKLIEDQARAMEAFKRKKGGVF